ncbi:MAG: RDD family protein [Candidatus Wallbacteria bacterium]
MDVFENICRSCHKKVSDSGSRSYYGVPYCNWCYYKIVLARFAAFLIDMVIWPFIFMFIVFFILLILFDTINAFAKTSLNILKLGDFAGPVMVFLSFMFKDIAAGRKSIGKKVAGLKIISRRTGAPPLLAELIKRNAVLMVPFVWPYAAWQILRNGVSICDEQAETAVVFENDTAAEMLLSSCNIKRAVMRKEIEQGADNYLKSMKQESKNPVGKNLSEKILPVLEVAVDRKNLRIYTENLDQYNPETGEDFNNVAAFLFQDSFFISIDKKISRYDISSQKVVSEILHPDYNRILFEAGLDKLDSISLTPFCALDEKRILWFLRGYDSGLEFLAVPVVLMFTDYMEEWLTIKPLDGNLKMDGTAPKKILKTDNSELFILQGDFDAGAEAHIDEFIMQDIFYSIDVSNKIFKPLALKKIDDFQPPDVYFLEACDYSMMKILSDFQEKIPGKRIERSFKWHPADDMGEAYTVLNERSGKSKCLCFSISDHKENAGLVSELKSANCSNLLLTAKCRDMVILVDFISSHRHVIFRCWKLS